MILTSRPVLKHRPADFLVREVLVPRTCAESVASHEYFTLGKWGLTTIEAIRIIAEAFDVASTAVTYGGLKDEDAITDQLVALPRGTTQCPTWEHSPTEGRYLRLTHQGYGPEPLTIGGLEGNAFRIVVRGLDPVVAERLGELHKINFFSSTTTTSNGSVSPAASGAPTTSVPPCWSHAGTTRCAS